MSAEDEVRGKGSMTRNILLILVVILIIVVGVLGFSYAKASSQSSEEGVQVASLKSEITSNKAEISTLKSQVSTLQGQLSSANSQITSLKTDLDAAKKELSKLQEITSLKAYTNYMESSTINQGAGQTSVIAKFKAQYAGFVTVTGTSTTHSGYVKLANLYAGYPFNNTEYAFGTGGTVLIPVLPGDVEVVFGNKDIVVGATATLTVVYYY